MGVADDKTISAGSAAPESSEEDLAPGTPVGEYVVDHKLGEGGLGVVPGLGQRSDLGFEGADVAAEIGISGSDRLAGFGEVGFESSGFLLQAGDLAGQIGICGLG